MIILKKHTCNTRLPQALIFLIILGIGTCGSSYNDASQVIDKKIPTQTNQLKTTTTNETIASDKEDKQLTRQSIGNNTDSQPTWDIDGDGQADALTDGLLLLRYTFGMRGNSLIQGSVSDESLLSAPEIELQITSILSIADIDGDNRVDALSDGLLLLRYLFGVTGEQLVMGAISDQATRVSVTEITQYLLSFMPSSTNDSTQNTISGKVTFDLVPFQTYGQGLDINNTYPSAARGVLVEALNNTGTVIASGNTDANGNYLLLVEPDLNLFIRVSAMMIQTTGPQWDVKVTDNTSLIDNENPLYVTNTSSFDTSENRVRDIHLPSGLNGQNAGIRSAAPFAVLDAVYDAMQTVAAIEPTIVFPPLELHWSPKNNSSSGSWENGDIGTTFYDVGGKIYILGSEFLDTDEYDRHVIIHEWGHYFEDKLSRSDSIGGSHNQDELLDMRVAFSEAWGNTISAIVTNDSLYRDSNAFWPYFGWSMDLESYSSNAVGWYSETSLQQILYDIYDTNPDYNDSIALGFEPIYSALRSSEFINSDFLTSIYLFSKILKDSQPPETDVKINNLLTAEQIFGYNENGIGETNSGGIDTALPIYKTITANNGPINLCYDNSAGVVNKLGNKNYATLSISSAGIYRFTLRPNELVSYGLDADLLLFKQGVKLAEDLGSQKNGRAEFSINLEAGNHIVEMGVWDPNSLAPTGSHCFNLEVSN